MELARGENAILPNQKRVCVSVEGHPAAGAVQVACFLLDASGHALSPDMVVASCSPRGGAGSVEFIDQAGTITFVVDLARVPVAVQKCVIAASLFVGTFRTLQGLRVVCRGDARELRYHLQNTGDERCLILAEVYRHSSGWKFRAVGQGIAGDLPAFARRFGATMPSAPATASSSNRSSIPQQPQASPVQLGKILLDKPAASAALSLAKATGGFREVRVRMTWHTGVDLDLHAFYRLKDGRLGHVYFADKGALHAAPWIALDQDAAVDRRSGNHEENLCIAKIEAVESILFAANIFTLSGLLGFGNENFARYDGVVTVSTGSQDIVVPLASSEPGRWAVIARLDNGTDPRVTRIDKVVKKQPTLLEFSANP